jgi:hypothetical protein
MIAVSFARRRALPAFVAGAIMSIVAFSAMPARASAAEPWWHVTTISAPAGAQSTAARVVLDVSNVGDAATPGTAHENLEEARHGESRHLVSVLDTLPQGVEPKEAKEEGEGTLFAPREERYVEEQLKHNLCSIKGQTVSCTYVAPVRAYEQIVVQIDVYAQAGAGGGVNEVTVSGAGAPTVRTSHRLALEGPVSYGVQSYELTPEEEGGMPTRQAGRHPFQLTSTLMLDTKTGLVKEGGTTRLEVEPSALTKDLRFYLPPGLVGNPTPLPKCSTYIFLQQFSNGSVHCPNDTVIGVSAPIIAYGTFYTRLSALYSLEPSEGEPARFGFFTLAGPVVIDTSVATGVRYEVIATVPNVLSNVPFIGSVVTFWGAPADSRHDASRNIECLEDAKAQETGGPEPSCSAGERPQPFLIMPTSCTGPLQSSVEADSWSEIGQWTPRFDYTSQNSVGEPYGLDGCNVLNFEPSIKVAPDTQHASTPSGLSVDVHVSQDASLNPEGLAEATVKDTTVTLPAGVALNPAGGDGLLSCALAQIELSSPLEQSCPKEARVGSLEIHTPLLPKSLVGAAYLAAQEENPFGSLLALYLVVYDKESGVRVKLAGEVKPDPVTGQLVSTFRETPQLPFEDLKLHFYGGERAPLATPPLCGSYQASAQITPWSENTTANISSSPFAITSGPHGSPCASPLPFAPELTAGSLNLQAGAFTPFKMTMSREDGQQSLHAVSLHMPPGLSGLLTGVELCPEPQANEGACGPNSLIGETTVSVGLGNEPFTVKGGHVYITGPYEGAPFGLSIVNPAKAGPFDLEKTKASHPSCDCLVVRARIEIDPITAQLTISSDTAGSHAIPTMLEGIPLQIKHVNVTIDRQGFTFNPTDCEAMKITGSVQSAEGATGALSVPFQVTNCATLAFKPSFKVSTSAKTSRQRGAGLRVLLSYPKAPFASQANIRSVKVSLPRQLPSRLTTLQKACADSVFDANPAACPAASRVGTGRAITPLIPVPLAGPAYFVSHGGAKFPELIVVLQGYGVTIDLHGETFISKAGITSSTFRTVPDAPVGSFQLNLPQGPYSALTAKGSLCAHRLTMPTAFTAQNGLTIRRVTPIGVSGCRRHRVRRAGRHRGHRHGKGARARRR